MANDTFFDDKSIVIIDKEKDKGNDRTWCFWESDNNEWNDIINKRWKNIYFGSQWSSKEIDISPYEYKMIKSESFYKKLWKTIHTKSNISFHQALVSKIETKGSIVSVETDNSGFEGLKVFNSLNINDDYKKQSRYPVLQQHFIGWFVKTETPCFDADVATFMDFDIPQKGNTRFMYVLPTSKTEALFEYTLFSKELLKKAEYEEAIKTYLKQKGIEDYIITEKEMGSIPMTSFDFSKQNSEHLLHIGTAGGWTKASTGYTFMNSTKKTKELVAFLKRESNLKKFSKRTKFWFYDLLMLDVLASDNSYGAELFTNLFKKSKTTTIFKFLDEESTFTQDFKIVSSVPPMRFIKALLRRLF
jgi:lycopene beta-cyclase